MHHFIFCLNDCQVKNRNTELMLQRNLPEICDCHGFDDQCCCICVLEKVDAASDSDSEDLTLNCNPHSLSN